MRVVIQQSGGFTGIPVTSEVDAESLSSEETEKLRQLMDSAGFFDLPTSIPGTVYPDQLEYRVSVEANGRRHQVTVSESSLSVHLKALIDWVRDAGRGR